MKIIELHKLQEHALGVSALAYNEKKGVFYSGSLDKTIKVWYLNTNKDNLLEKPELLQSIKAHEKWISDLTYVSKYSYLLSSSFDRTIKLWDTKSNILNYDFYFEKHLDYVQKLLYLKKLDKFVSCGFDCKIFIWNLKNFQISSIIERYKSPIISLACTEDESILIMGSFNSDIIVWNLEKNQQIEILRGQGPIKDLKVIPSHNVLVGVDNYGGFFGYNINNFEQLFSKQIDEQLNSLEIISIDKEYFIILGGTSKLYVYSFPPIQEITEISAHNDKIEALLTFQTPYNKKFLLSGSLDNSIKLWELKKD